MKPTLMFTNYKIQIRRVVFPRFRPVNAIASSHARVSSCHQQRARTRLLDTHGSCCCCSGDPREHRATLLTGWRGTREKGAADSTQLQNRGTIETRPSPGCLTTRLQRLPRRHTERETLNLRMPEGRVFPVWRGIGSRSGVGGGWSQGWGRCLRWEADTPEQKARIPVFDYPVWLVLCRGGRARLIEVCQRGRGAIRLPTDMLSIKLPQLFDIHQVPKVFREDGIISGYRHPRSSALDCVLSSFQMNNETMNIWTHFLPTWYFLWRFCVLCSTQNFLTDSYTWPLLVYMLLICIYPFTSSCAHTFSTMSPESRHICYFFDYGALSLYSLGCAISYGYYVIPDSWVNSWLQQHFVPIAIGNTLFCTSLSCYSRFLELQFPQRSKVLRTGAFVLPFIFDTVPLFYRILLCCGGSCSSSDALSSHCYHLLFAFLTCFLFTAHLPERLAPGRFDYFGHSHQLFHVSAVVGTHFQMEGVITDMTSRRAALLAHGAMPSFLGTVGVLVLSLFLNLGIIGIFSAPLLWKPCSSNQPNAPTCEVKEQ